MKRIIHTYVNQKRQDIGVRKDWFSFNNDKEPSIEYHQLLGMLISVHYAIKHYKNITLYSTLDIINLISDIGIPYTGFSKLEDNIKSTYGPFAIPKLIVYSKQKDPFIHIDYDTFLINKLDENISSKPFAFSHEDLKNFDHSILTIRGLVPAYVDWLQYHADEVPDWWYKGEYISIDEIPNMNITSVNDVKTFNNIAVNPILEHYREHRENWDKGETSCVLEQLLIYVHLKNSNHKVDYFSDKNPTLIHYNDKDGCIENYGEIFDKNYFVNHHSYHHVFSHHLGNGGIQKILEEVAIDLGYEKQLNKIKLLFKR